jgi:hypothetical protein
VSEHAECRAVEQRLREANRRLQQEGPALERDKLIAELRERIAQQISYRARDGGRLRAQRDGWQKRALAAEGEVSRLREALDSSKRAALTLIKAQGQQFKLREAAESRLAQVTSELAEQTEAKLAAYDEIYRLKALLTPPAASDGPSTLTLHLDERLEGEKAQAIAAIRRSEKLTGADMSRRVGADDPARPSTVGELLAGPPAPLEVKAALAAAVDAFESPADGPARTQEPEGETPIYRVVVDRRIRFTYEVNAEDDGQAEAIALDDAEPAVRKDVVEECLYQSPYIPAPAPPASQEPRARGHYPDCNAGGGPCLCPIWREQPR